MTIPRPCLDCGGLTPVGNRCEPCRRKVEAARSAARGPRPHYAGNYRARAKAVREAATVCWYCGQGAKATDPWQADHLIPADPSSPLAAIHRRCNIRRAHGLPPLA